MNHRNILCFLLALAATILAVPSANADDVSIHQKTDAAVDKGLTWLAAQQKPDGFWSSNENPGLTGLCVQAFLAAPAGKHRGDDAVKRGLDFIRHLARPDGGIYSDRLGNYNTSICLLTLLRAGEAKDAAIIDAAHAYLVGGQTKNSAVPSNDGGFGYESGGSGRGTRPDLDNTVYVLEAMRQYRQSHGGKESASAGPQLNWQAALDFVTRCQQASTTTPSEDRGGFGYTPGSDGDRGPAGERASRSYGSMTYAGVLSFIYTDLKKDDPRVTAALDWISRHYTLEENPGQGAQGLYYYYHLMAKGLTAAGIDQLQLSDDRKVNWRAELAAKLLALQKPDGSWASDNGRWMEKDPNLVTAYCLLALELLEGNL